MAKSKETELEITAKLNGVEDWKEWCKSNGKKTQAAGGSGGALYFVGFIGAIVYWMQTAVGFGAVVTGILKAGVWPAYVVYKLLQSFYG